MLYNNNVIEKLAEYYEDDIDVYRGKEIVKNFDSGYEYVLSPSLVFKKNPITFHVCHMATYIRKDAFERFGLYDETFRYAMDEIQEIELGKFGVIKFLVVVYWLYIVIASPTMREMMFNFTLSSSDINTSYLLSDYRSTIPNE